MRTTNHPLEPEELMAFLDGELQPDRATRAAEHLASCHECQEIASDLRNVSGRMAEWRVEAPVLIAPHGRAQVRELPWYRRRLVWGLVAAGALGVYVFVPPSYDRKPPRMAAMQMAQDRSFRPPAPTPAAQPAPSGDTLAPLVAHTARLTLVADNFDRARDTLQEILKRHHGYIAEMTVNAEESSARSLDASVKTPDGQLDATMTEIKALGRVLSEPRGGEEVSQQSIDLGARLANARNTEERLTDLLQHRTDKLADILAVENQISETRGQIEQMEAERKNLTNRVEYAKLDVRITEEYTAKVDGGSSTSTRLRNAAVEGYAMVVDNLLAVLAGALSYGPVVLVWCAILFFPVRFAWRRLRRA